MPLRWYGKERRFREILFDGTLEEALELLECGSRAAGLLGMRFLLHHRAASMLEPRIALALLDVCRGEGISFLAQARRIQVLGRLERETPTGALVRLFAIREAGVESGARPPTTSADTAAGGLWAAQDVRENHSLTWVLRETTDAGAQRRYGARLIHARDQAVPGWREEIQLALNACRIEDLIALENAVAHGRASSPVYGRVDGIGDDADAGRIAGIVPLLEGDGVVTSSADGVLRRWSGDSVEQTALVNAQARRRALLVDPEGTRILCENIPASSSGSGDALVLVDLVSDVDLWVHRLSGARPVRHLRWPKTREFLVHHDRQLRSLSLASGKTVSQASLMDLPTENVEAWFDSDAGGLVFA